MPKTVMLVDADAALRSQLSRALSGAGYKVQENGDGREVVEQLRAQPPSAVVLCVELPKGSGYAICSKLRKDETLKDVRVILTSAEATQKSFDDHRKLRNGRADEYMLKPFSADDLLKKISALVGPGAEGDDEALGLSGLASELDDHKEEKVSLEEVEEIWVEDDLAPTSHSLPGEQDVDMLESAFERLEDKPSKSPRQVNGHAEEEEDEEVSHEEATRIGPPPTRMFAGDDEAALSNLEAPLESEGASASALGLADDEPLSPLSHDEPPPLDEPLESLEPAPEEPIHEPEPEVEPVREAARPAPPVASTPPLGGSRDKEYFQLKDKLAQREKELLRIREELTGKEKELLEQREHETSVEREVSAKDEEIHKRDQQIKQLQQKNEALVAGQRRTERDLTTAREEARNATTRADAADHAKEVAENEAHEQKSRAEQLDEELTTARSRLAELESETERQRSHNDELQAELTGVRAQLDDANTTIDDLRRQMDDQRQESEASQEDLRRRLSDTEDEKQKHEERVVKAFQRLKGEEKLREKAKKALGIALQLLDEPVSSDEGDLDAESEDEHMG